MTLPNTVFDDEPHTPTVSKLMFPTNEVTKLIMTMTHTKKTALQFRSVTLVSALLAGCTLATTAPPTLAQAQHESKVDLQFNTYYTFDEMTTALHDLVKAYPDMLSIQSLGQSVAGRDMWIVTLNNPKTGKDTDKTAMFIDANIHGNEVQGAETVLYSIWYLTKSYGKIDHITKLVDERAFYFLPMENPDGRSVFLEEASTPHHLRGGIKPTDNDHDGLYDEDGYDDLDGDGHITSMWMPDPLGRFKRDPKDDRFFIRVGQDEEPGGWTNLGSEGYDNDDDGSINEDGIGGYDPNRNWPSDWQPLHVQYGADDYPFSLPETRAIADFIEVHPNIAGFQSYHNTGGMILRGPGANYVSYPREDTRFYDKLGAEGEAILPFYDYMIIHEDLYTVHGGEVNWAAEGLGIASFTNELWTDKKMFQRQDGPSQEERKKFRDLLQFGDVYVPYKEFDHPQFGMVLIGGTKKYSSRVTPPWALEEGCHRNFAFTMFHADEMPQVSWGKHDVRSIGDNLWQVTVQVENDKIIPTITGQARVNRIGNRDYMECKTLDKRADVVASGSASSFLPHIKMTSPTEHQPERIWNARGIGSESQRMFRFLVTGSGEVQLEYYSQKGGTITMNIPLEESLATLDDESNE